MKWLYPEECPGPFYMGWWLYLRDRNDGSENDDTRPEKFWDQWGWLRHSHHLAPVRELLIRLGHADAPAVPSCSPPGLGQKFGEWFAKNYPRGLAVEVSRDHRGEPERYEAAAGSSSTPEEKS